MPCLSVASRSEPFRISVSCLDCIAPSSHDQAARCPSKQWVLQAAHEELQRALEHSTEDEGGLSKTETLQASDSGTAAATHTQPGSQVSTAATFGLFEGPGNAA